MATFGAGHAVLHEESMAGQTQAIVRTATATATARREAAALGLAVEQTSIQRLVVAMSLAAAQPAAPSSLDRATLQGAHR